MLTKVRETGNFEGGHQHWHSRQHQSVLQGKLGYFQLNKMF